MSSADEEKANKASLLRLSSMFSNFVGSGSRIFPFSEGVEISKSSSSSVRVRGQVFSQEQEIKESARRIWEKVKNTEAIRGKNGPLIFQS